jgi:outer membrane receptor protein involved in Fe transport
VSVYRLVSLLLSTLTLTLSFSALPARGQATNASLSGLVRDASDAVVPGVYLTATNQATGIKSAVISNKTGAFEFAGLLPGTYTLHAKKQGYKITELKNIRLTVAQEFVQDIKLEVGPETQTVSVSARQPELNSTNGAVSTVIGRQLIEDLPLNGRSLDTLFELTPGVVYTGGVGGYVINGQRATANNLTIDGASANVSLAPVTGSNGNNIGGIGLPESASGGTNGVLPIDALEEYRIQTSTYSAEFGRTPGGQIQVRSRAGSDQYHGTLFEYLRNQVFDATDWFIEHDDQKQPALRMNDFGGTFGGPLWRKKLFFFAAHETLLMHQPQFRSFAVPDASIKQMASPVFQPFLSAFPDGNGGPDSKFPGSDIYNEPYSNIIKDNSTSARVDANLGSRLHIFGRLNLAPSSFYAGTLPNPSTSNINYHTLMIGAMFSASQTLTNDFTLSYAHSVGNQEFGLENIGNSDVNTTIQYVKSLYDTTKGQFDFQGPGNSNFGFGPSVSNTQGQWNIVDTLSLARGRHEIRAGLDYRRTTPIVQPNPRVDVVTGQTDLQTIESGIVEELYYASPGSTFTSFPFVYNNLSLFGQDTWRITDRLTVDYGLRWDINPAPTDGRGGPLAFTGNAQDPASLMIAPSGTPLWRTRFSNLAPRLGLAYRLTQKPNFETVVRGGVGLFYDTGTSNAAQGALYEQYPYGVSGNELSIPFKQIDFSTFSYIQPTLPAYNLFAFDPKLTSPYTSEWSVSVEQQLGLTTALTTSYLGNVGENLLSQAYYAGINSASNQLILTTNAGRSNYQALQIQLHSRLKSGLLLYTSYTWSHALDTVDNEFDQPSGGIPLVLANAGFDIRHMFAGALHAEVPVVSSNLFAKYLLKGLSFEAIARLQTASPLTVQANYDPIFAAEFNQANPNADIVRGIPVVISNPAAPGGKQLNAAAFAQPAAGTQGDSGVNAYRLFGLTQFDMAASKVVFKRERFDGVFRVDAFNLLNIPNFANVDTYLPDTTFGQAFDTYAGTYGSSSPSTPGLNQVFSNGGPRNIQFSVKLRF